MLHKSLILIGFSAFIAFVGHPVVAQTPEPRKDNNRVFSWSFDGGSYLGVETAEVNRSNFAKFGLRDVRGVAVEKVLEGSPAQAAGLQAGDIIVRFNGQEVSSSRMLTRLVNEIDPDHTARITVIRGGSEREINVIVGKRPTPKWDDSTFNFKFPDNFPNIETPNIQIPKIPPIPNIDVNPHIQVMPNLPNWNGDDFDFHFGSRRQIGVSVMPLTKQLADSFGVAGGTMVSEVRENSPAAKAGLKAGDIIVEIDGSAVKGDGDLIRAINEKKDGEITVTFVRNGNRQTVKVTPEEFKGGDFKFFYEGPDAPKTPGTMNLIKPDKLPAPMPLNNLMVPGRVI